MKYNILIGGGAGSGMNTLAKIINVGLKRNGYYVYTYNEVMSRIRGGHNFFQIRFSNEPVESHDDDLDVIIAFDKETIKLHQARLKKEGILISDTSSVSDASVFKWIDFDLKGMCKTVGNPRGINTMLLGVFVKVFGLNKSTFEELIEEKFADRNLTGNMATFSQGYKVAEVEYHLSTDITDDHIIINGNEAIALGALTAGMAFYSAYPMTPATSIMSYLSKHQREAGILVEQAEDEIAAIHMAMGSAYTGVRSMTASSGGGIALMVEGIGLAAVSELPLVVVDVQRPGPATGMATKTSQSDLSFILNASQDEFPRMIMAVRNQEDAFYQTVRAFDIADKYQMLVFVLNDEYLADASMTINRFNFDNIEINNYLADENALEADGSYKRFKFTDSGVSPRLIPGHVPVPIVFDSHEHDEYGKVVEDGDNRTQMHLKRLRKLETLASELVEPEYFGADSPELVLVGFGSTYGAMKEAVKDILTSGTSVGMLSFGDVYPLPQKEIKKYRETSKLINVELNATGQLAKLIKLETGITFDDEILKFNGRQISKNEIIAKVREVL